MMETSMQDILKLALARLVVTLRALCLQEQADVLEQAYLPDDLARVLFTGGMDLHSRAQVAMFVGVEDPPSPERLASARRAAAAETAAAWLRQAINEKSITQTMQDALAREALRLLAEPERNALAETIEGLCAGDATTTVMDLLPRLSDSLDAYHVALGRGEEVAARKAAEGPVVVEPMPFTVIEAFTASEWFAVGKEHFSVWLKPGDRIPEDLIGADATFAARIWRFHAGSNESVWGWRVRSPWGEEIDGWDAKPHPERKPATSTDEALAFCNAALTTYCTEREAR
jgi:hypothetical protein